MISTQPTRKGTADQESPNIHTPDAILVPADARRAGLKPGQWRAVEMLAAGARIVDVARMANVHRNTVGRWLDDPIFVEQLRNLDRRLHLAARSRVTAMTQLAATSVEHALARGDSRLGLQVLKAHRLFDQDLPLRRFTSKSLDDLVGPNDADLHLSDEIAEEDAGDAPRGFEPTAFDPGDAAAKSEDSAPVNAEPTNTEPGKDVSGKGSGGTSESDAPNRYFSPRFGNLAPDWLPDDEPPRSDGSAIRHFTRNRVCHIRHLENPTFGDVLWCFALWFQTHYSAPFRNMRRSVGRFLGGFWTFGPSFRTSVGYPIWAAKCRLRGAAKRSGRLFHQIRENLYGFRPATALLLLGLELFGPLAAIFYDFEVT